MYINNELRDLVYRNNLQHGFWDNIRSYDEFVHNLVGEFEETEEELRSGRKPTEVYFKKGNKPEGAPTELADIIIFILDYFGGSEPQIDVDEVFLETPDEYYKNPEHYEKAKQIEPKQYFVDIKKLCRNHISMSAFHHLLHGNEPYEESRGWGMYKETDAVVEERQKVNDTVLGKRKAREKLENGEVLGEEGESRG